MILKTGTLFTGKHFTGIVEVLSGNDNSNELKVKCSKDGSEWEETWNLEHTLWGFDLEEYTEIVIKEEKPMIL
jgi:hypothetical protein